MSAQQAKHAFTPGLPKGADPTDVLQIAKEAIADAELARDVQILLPVAPLPNYHGMPGHLRRRVERAAEAITKRLRGRR